MKSLFVGLESIQFQSPQFFNELTMVCQRIKELPAKDIPDSNEAHNLTKIIKAYTNLAMSFEMPLEHAMGPHVMVPEISKNHPLANDFIRGWTSSADGIRLIHDAGGVLRGGVDLAAGKVFGAFTDIPVKVVVPVSSFKTTGKYGLIPEEIAAVILHEVGHILTYFEYISRTATTNQVLAGLSRELDGGDVNKREAALITVKKAAGLKDLDIEALTKSTSNHVVEVAVVSSIVKKSVSELGRNVYDTSTWEMLADQYVTRYGAGRHLASALDKIYRGAWNISFRSLPSYLAMEAFKLLMIVALPGAFFFFLAYDGEGDGTYDRPGARIARVRSQIVENLKDRSLSKDDVYALEADLAAIDSMLEQINDRRQFFGVVWDFISPGARKDRSYKKLQQDLEAIAANDLFAKAATLKQLA